MDQIVFRFLRSAAILFYLVAVIAGCLVLALIAALTLELVYVDSNLNTALLAAMLCAITPTAVGFALDRLAMIGTRQSA